MKGNKADDALDAALRIVIQRVGTDEPALGAIVLALLLGAVVIVGPVLLLACGR